VSKFQALGKFLGSAPSAVIHWFVCFPSSDHQKIKKIKYMTFQLEIDRLGFFEADTDISAIHGPIYRPIPIFPNF